MTPHLFRYRVARLWPQIESAGRGTIAALAALALAVFLELECPYWAAMTALIVIQPTRGLFLEKSFYRLIGSVLGATAGLFLLLYLPSPPLLTGALIVWVTGCVAIGNLLNGFRSYAFLLASYTCVIIAMLGLQDPAHFRELAVARIIGIVVGIAVTTVVTIVTTRRLSKDAVMDDLHRMTGDVIRLVALLLQQGRSGEVIRRERQLLLEISGMETRMETINTGTFQFWRKKRCVRNLLAVLLSLVAIGREVGQCPINLSLPLEAAADGMYGGEAPADSARRLAAIAAEASSEVPLLGALLGDLAVTLEMALEDDTAEVSLPPVRPRHRILPRQDRQQAVKAAVRAAVALVCIAGVWFVSGWQESPLMFMGTAIMVSLFSTKDHSAATVGHAFIGAATGVAAALLCRLALIPAGTAPLVEGAVVAPFLFCGILALSYRRTAVGAFDALLIFLLVTRPCCSPGVAGPELVPGAIAVLTGIGAAWCAFRYLLPVTPASRLRSVRHSIGQTLGVLAASHCQATTEKQVAHMHHLVLRLIAIVRHDDIHDVLAEEGLAALAASRSMQQAKGFMHAVRLPEGVPPVP